jgi:hypothetical protein
MSSEICFRDYRATDLEAMFQLDEACFAEEFRFDRESMREFAEEQNAVVRIAEKGSGEIVGFVIVHVERVVSGWRAYVVTLQAKRPGQAADERGGSVRNGYGCAVDAVACVYRQRWSDPVL